MRLAPMKAFQQLQLEVLARLGINPLQPSDCKDLSQSVQDATGKVVSETTIKRVFGFAAQTFNFSIYTLNALSEYAGYANWEAFHERQWESQKAGSHAVQSKWQDIKSRIDKITYYSTESIRNGSGIDFPKTIPRQDCTSHLRRFLTSDASITAVIAPSGYGKSVALTHAMNELWLDDEAAYPNDICLLVNLHQISTLLSKGFSLEDWLDNQLSLGNGENQIEYFEHNLHERGGHFVFILDGFDERIIQSDKLKIIYNKLMDFLFSRKEISWLKIVLSIRSETWHNILYPALTTSGAWKYWYKIENAFTSHQGLQLPLLSRQEIGDVLQKHGYADTFIDSLEDDLVELLKFPVYLQLYCSSLFKKYRSDNSVSIHLYEIISQYVNLKVISSSDVDYKLAIIKRTLEQSGFLFASFPEESYKKTGSENRIQDTCKKLITDNILTEEHSQGQSAFRLKKVVFFNAHLAEYFCCYFYLLAYNFAIKEELIDRLMNDLKTMPGKLNILKWLLVHAMQSDQQLAIPHLFRHIHDLKERALLLEFLLVYYPKEKKLTPVLHDLFADAAFKQHFFCGLINYEYVLQHKLPTLLHLAELLSDEEDLQTIRYLLFLTGVLHIDAPVANSQVPYFREELQRNGDPYSALHPAELCLFISDHLNHHIPSEITREKIDQPEEYLILPHRTTTLTAREDLTIKLLVYATIVQGDSQRLKKIVAYIFGEIPDVKFRPHDPIRSFLLLMQGICSITEDRSVPAKSLAHLEKTFRIYRAITSHHMLDCIFFQLKATHYFHAGQYTTTIEVIQQGLKLVRKVNLRTIEYWLHVLITVTYRRIGKQKLMLAAQQRAEQIAQSCGFHEIPPANFDRMPLLSDSVHVSSS